MAKKKDEAEKTSEPATSGGESASGESAPATSTTPSIEGSEAVGDTPANGADTPGEPSAGLAVDDGGPVAAADPPRRTAEVTEGATQSREASLKPTPQEIEAAMPKPGEALVGDCILACLKEECMFQGLSAEFPTAPFGSNHAWTCPSCGGTGIDTSQIARAWALKGPRPFPFGNDNTLS